MHNIIECVRGRPDQTDTTDKTRVCSRKTEMVC